MNVTLMFCRIAIKDRAMESKLILLSALQFHSDTFYKLQIPKKVYIVMEIKGNS